jgi:dihydroflavonol-4-reductase
MAAFSELGAQLTGREPLVLRSQVALYYGRNDHIRNAKARRELGYNPRPSREAIRDAYQYLLEREQQAA